MSILDSKKATIELTTSKNISSHEEGYDSFSQDSDLEHDSARISHRKRNKKVKYHHISNHLREEIITRVLDNGEKITKVEFLSS